MTFQWDEGNIPHIARHGVAPEEAEQVFFNGPLQLSSQHRSNEARVVIIGKTDTGRILVVTWTLRGEQIRVVTAFTAKRRLCRLYEEEKKGD